ncbi:MAG: helix-turn-helix domain-containing protein [bacterium]|nr:helix-turn-helix domain-containing protein [bacterium]
MRCMIGLGFIDWFVREGMSKSRVADRLRVSRNTVVRLLSLDEPLRYRRKPRG